jgi:hypothetical protein
VLTANTYGAVVDASKRDAVDAIERMIG